MQYESCYETEIQKKGKQCCLELHTKCLYRLLMSAFLERHWLFFCAIKVIDLGFHVHSTNIVSWSTQTNAFLWSMASWFCSKKLSGTLFPLFLFWILLNSLEFFFTWCSIQAWITLVTSWWCISFLVNTFSQIFTLCLVMGFSFSRHCVDVYVEVLIFSYTLDQFYWHVGTLFSVSAWQDVNISMMIIQVVLTWPVFCFFLWIVSFQNPLRDYWT